jgi:hypothetical protein
VELHFSNSSSFFSLPKPLGKVSNALLDDDHLHRSPSLLQGVIVVAVVAIAIVVVEMANVILVVTFKLLNLV